MKTACGHCGKQFSVPETWRNTRVRCPQCNGEVFAGEQQPPTQKQQPRRQTESEEVSDRDVADEDDYSLAPEVERPQADLFMQELSEAKPKRGRVTSEATPIEAGEPQEARQKICPNCDSILPPDGMLCVECGYHLVMKRVLQTELQEVDYDESIGIERWLNRQISEFESLDSMIWAWHAVLLAMGSILAAVFHPTGWLVFMVLAIAYTIWYQYTRRHNGFRAWGDWLWLKYLRRQRRRGWRGWAPYSKPLAQFTSHSPQFGDEQLLELEDVELLEVLDLEGTRVSPRSFSRLAGCDRLRYIVLRNTRVTPSAARRLQIMLPDANLWV